MRFPTLSAWLSWQETLHPQEIDLGLERIAVVWRRMAAGLGTAKVIVVAGTNGKGSCVAMLASIYRAAGYQVGAYTSPHLLRYNERVCINGRPVSDESLCLAFERVDRARGTDSLSYFEFGTLAALSIFSQQSLDVVLLEVGLGGRLDAVNIIDADVALISSVAIDHCDWLGDDRESIGVEKAGIFRPGRAAVCGDPLPPASVLEQARLHGAELHCLGRDFQLALGESSSTWSWSSDGVSLVDLPQPRLPGRIQLNNAASVLQALALLDNALPVAVDAIRQGLQQVELAGRYQRLYCRLPLQACGFDDDDSVATIVDVAHNPAAALALAQTLRDESAAWLPGGGQVRAVLGMLADKDVAAVVAALDGVVGHWYVAEPAVPRACPVAELRAALAPLRGEAGVTVCTTVAQAAGQALLDARAAPGDDCLLVLGSFYTVAEFMAALSA